MKKLFLGLAVVLGFGLCAYVPYSTVETVDIKVESKERVGTTYLIFTEKEVFQSADSWAFLKFNSSDVYGKLKEGATCKVKVNGFRIGLLSMYRNIITATC